MFVLPFFRELYKNENRNLQRMSQIINKLNINQNKLNINLLYINIEFDVIPQIYPVSPMIYIPKSYK